MKLHHKSLLACTFATLLCSAQVSAHTTVSPKQASPNSYQRLSFNVTHGCEGSPTTELILQLPVALMGAKPMPKPGWTVGVDVRELDQPYLSHGREVRSDVRVIRWKGRLPDAFYDEFVIMARLWDKAGAVAIPVTQICESGRIDWAQVPDGSGAKLNFPAPLLEVLPGQHPHPH